MRTRIRGLVVGAMLGIVTGCAAQGNTSSPTRTTPSPSIPVAAPAPNAARENDEPESEQAATRSPVLIEGSGALVGKPRAERSRGLDSTAAATYQLNFVDTEITSIVTAVLGDILNVPHVIDPRVKGTMTLQGTGPLRQSDILPALEAALRVQDIAIVKADGVYNVLPSKDAPRRITSIRAPSQAADATGFMIRLVPLRYIGAAEMEKALRSFSPDGGILRVDEARNLLLLAGTSQELQTMQDVVALFDVDWLEGMSFGLFPLSYVDPKTLAGELEQLFADQKSPIGSVVRLVPLARLNSLMVVTSQAHYLKSVGEWVSRLDVAASTPGRRIYVYDVQNGKAADLAESLNRILSISSDSSSSGTGPSSTIMNTSRDAAGIGQRFSAATPSSDTALDTGILKIVPNEESNSLLILASPSEYAVISTAVRKLDVMPLQVLIEASLAEVTLNDDLRYGIQWSYFGNDGPVVLSESSSGAINQRFPGFSYLFTGRSDIRAVLNALESITNVNVISSPKLLVLNNHEARLQIGDQVPIIVQSSVSTNTSDAPIVNSVEMRDTGVILSVTPRVNKNGLALLEINQEVSDVAPTTSSSINSPTIQQRKLSSSVAVHDGATIALGGLIRDSQSRGREGIPFLRRLPIIGDLFGSTTKGRRRTELIVLITPRVIRSPVDAEATMRELRDQFDSLGKRDALWGGSASAGSTGDEKSSPSPTP